MSKTNPAPLLWIAGNGNVKGNGKTSKEIA